MCRDARQSLSDPWPRLHVSVHRRFDVRRRVEEDAGRRGMHDARAERARRQMKGHSDLREYAGGRREGSGRPCRI